MEPNIETMVTVTLRLKNPKYGNTQDAWWCIQQSLKSKFKGGWKDGPIQKDFANGSVSIPFPNEQEAGDFLSTLVQKKGLDLFTIQ